MSVLVYTESEEGTFKKIAFEAVSYAKGIADMLGTSVTAISINGNNTDQLGKYGASKVLQVSNDQLLSFNAVTKIRFKVLKQRSGYPHWFPFFINKN